MARRADPYGASWRSSFRALARLVGIGLVLMVSVSRLSAQTSDLDDFEDPGAFEVIRATHELIDGVYNVDATIYLRLSTEAVQKLHASVPLSIRIEVEFLNRLRFWMDNTEFEKDLSYRLQYRSLSDRYVVQSVDAGPSSIEGGRAFTTLEAALNYIGQVDDLPIVDRSLLDSDRRYEVRVRAVLDKTELLGPIWLFAFMRKDWSIGSEWYSWRLDAG